MSTEIRERPRRLSPIDDRVSTREVVTQATSTQLFWRVLAAALVLIAVAGCAGGDSDDRRTAALGEGEAEALSWRGDWTAEAEYQPGEVVTHEGVTFVAVSTTAQAPAAKCEVDCAWNVMAETGAATINTQQPPPPPKIQVFEYTTGYEGPVELPTPEFVGITDILSGMQRWQQAVDDWVLGIAPSIIRHRDDGGTIVGEKLLEQGGAYLVFARGVFVSAPGLGKATIPQSSTPNLGAMISAGSSIGKIGGLLKPIGIVSGQILNALMGAGASGPAAPEYSLACTLRANRQPIDNAAMSLTEKGTASGSLMGFMVASADVKFDVMCAHNGQKAGPFVRDLRLVVVKLD